MNRIIQLLREFYDDIRLDLLQIWADISRRKPQ